MLAGSLSYRPALPEHARASHLHDIDITLDPHGGRVAARDMVRRSRLTDSFSVINEAPMWSGSYFGLVHNVTRLWVDIYVAPHPLLTTQLWLGETAVIVQLPEETFFALVKDLLLRAQRRRFLAPKWVANARLLWRYLDRRLVVTLMERHEREYRPLVPRRLTSAAPYAVIDHVLSLRARTD